MVEKCRSDRHARSGRCHRRRTDGSPQVASDERLKHWQSDGSCDTAQKPAPIHTYGNEFRPIPPITWKTHGFGPFPEVQEFGVCYPACANSIRGREACPSGNVASL